MRLLIIGHSVIDRINQEGKVTTKPGGIFFTTAALRSLKKGNDYFELLTTLDDKNFNYFQKVFNSFNITYCQKLDEVLKINLTVFRDGSRKEIFSFNPEPLSLNTKLAIEQFDGILLNYIAGNDISLTDLVELRKKYSGIIYSDVHAMAKIGLPNQTRKIVKVPDYKTWLNQIDIVQTNEEEIRSISEGNSELEMVDFILEHRPRILIITKAERGAVLYYTENKMIKSIEMPAIKSSGNNFVGCGDVFGAYFFYSYIATRNIQSSFELAVKASGKITYFNKLKDFENFSEVKL